MEPFEQDELSEQELNGLLREWKAPEAPARLRAAVFSGPPRPWWQRLWRTSIHIPVPVACCLVLLLAVAAWRGSSRPAPRVIVRTERVEIPVVQDRVVTKTVYRDRLPSNQLQPVAELRPRIIRRGHVQN
jgi:hypothetical protein